MDKLTIAFLGGGNMATSLVGGLVQDGMSPKAIHVADVNQEKLTHLQQTYGVHTFADNEQAVANAQVVILAVKPQSLREAVQSIAPQLQQLKPLVVSIAAGVMLHSIENWVGAQIPMVRCMPNTPALVGAGATALFANSRVSEKQKEQAESILRAVGITQWLTSEDQIDIVTALSGSGPAYFFHLMECMQKAAEDLGLPHDVSRLFTLQTALGAAKMAMESDVDVATLRQRVTSPGGTTESALKVFDKSGFEKMCQQAMEAARDRGQVIATMFDDKE